MFGYDSGHTGVNPQDALVNAGNFGQLRLSWSDGGPAGLPAIADNHVFLPDVGFVLVYADQATCSPPSLACPEQWRLSATGTDGMDGVLSAAVVSGHVIVPDNDGNIQVYSEAPCGSRHCTPLWTGQTGGRASAELAVDGPTFFVGTGNVGNTTQVDGRLYAFPVSGCGAATCSPAWVGRIEGGGLLTGVATGGGRAYVADGFLRAFASAGCGAPECLPAWTARVSAQNVPTYAAGTVYGSGFDYQSGTTTLYAVDAASGTLRWNVTLFQGKPGGTYWAPHPSVSGGMVYVFDPTGSMRVFDAATGALAWTAPGSTNYGAGPVIADGMVFVALPADANGNGGGLAAYSLRGCGAVTCLPTASLHSGPGSIPPRAIAAVSAGRIYTDAVEVYALPGQ
jgi:outer membrane protein assembly factor BamB